MRFARFITSGGEETADMSTEAQPRKTLGVVLVGLPPGPRTTVERFAARGYEVLAAEVDDAGDVERGLAAVRAAMDALAARTPGGNIAVVGYGFGGRYAYLAVTRLGADAGAAFHGTGIGRHLDEAFRATKPLTLHFGDDDDRVPFDEIRAIKGALEGFATTEIYRYPGVGQGFALPESPAYDATAAQQAERRVFAILDALGA